MATVLSRLVTPAVLSHLPSGSEAVASKLSESGVCGVCIVRVLGVRKPTLFCTLSAASSSIPAASPTVLKPTFGTSPAVLDASDRSDGIPSTSSTQECPACLGLLSNTSILATVERAKSLFLKENIRGVTSFLVSVRVPTQLALRARLVGLVAAKTLGTETLAFGQVALRDPKRFDIKDPKKAQELAADKVPIHTDPAENSIFSILPHQIEVKEALKMILAHHLEPALQLPVDPQSSYHLDIGYDHPPTEYEFDFMAEIDKCGLHVKKKRKRVREGSVWRVMRSDEKNPIRVEGATWNHIVHASNQLSYEEFQKHGFLPLTRAAGSCIVSDLKYLHFSLWLAGRYNKYQRTVSNSRMEYKGERLVAESVEELAAAHIDKFFRADNHKFSSAGREDVDVLMLGSGRPFYFEVVNPRVLDASQEEVRVLQDGMNTEYQGKLRFLDLQLVGKNDTKPLKDSAATKKKSYSTLVRLSRGVPLAALEAVSRLRDIELKQQTPVRVQQSRSDMVRDKIVHELHVKPEDDGEEGEGGVRMYDLVRLNLTTSAGTYVKEFCHGDGGRTVPSLKELLNVDRAEVETLDVLHVHLDWPPSVES